MNVRTVDAQSYGGSENFERVRQEAEAALQYFTNYCHHNNLAAKSYLAFGTDPIEELTKLAEVIHKKFSDSIFFTSKLILKYDNGTSDSCTAMPR